MLTRRARCDNNASPPYEVRPKSEQVANVAGASRNDGIEASRPSSNDLLEPRANDLGPSERELSNHRREKRNPPLSRLHQRELQLGIDQLERNPGNAGAGPGVKDLPCLRGNHAPEQKTVQEDVLHDPARLARA